MISNMVTSMTTEQIVTLLVQRTGNNTGLLPTTAQSLVSTLLHVSATNCSHLQGAIVLR